MLGSLARLARGYLPLLALVVATLALCGAFEPAEDGEERVYPAWSPGLSACLLIFVPVFGLHLLSPFPYDDYQVPIMPLLAIVTAVVFWQRLPYGGDTVVERRRQRIVVTSLLLWSTVAIGSSALAEGWMVLGKDRLWVVTKERSDLEELQRVGSEIAALVAPGERLLTQDLYLAVEARRAVPAGFEMGPFSYFPGLTKQEAERYKVLNRERLEEELRVSDAPVVALSGYGLALEAPEMTPVAPEDTAHFESLIEQRYELHSTVDNFGQEHTTLKIWKLK